MQPNSWKIFLFAILITPSGANLFSIRLDGAWAANLTTLDHQNHLSSKIKDLVKTEVTHQPYENFPLHRINFDLPKLGKLQLPQVKLNQKAFNSPDQLPTLKSINTNEVERLGQLDHPSYLSFSSLTFDNYCKDHLCPQENELWRLRSQVPENPEPNTTTSTPPNSEPNQTINNNPENLQKQNNQPQLEGQPNNFPKPNTEPIEKLLENPQIDYEKRLERLRKLLQEKKPSLPSSRRDGNLELRLRVRPRPLNQQKLELGLRVRPRPLNQQKLELGLRVRPRPLNQQKLELGLQVRPQPLPQQPVSQKPLEQIPPPTVEKPVTKFTPVGYLQGRIGYFHTSNIFSSHINPIDDGLMFYGLTLASAYLPLGAKTYINGSIDGTLIRYVDQSIYDYNQVRFNLSLYQQLSQKMYAEIAVSNQQLFYANNGDFFKAGDRFLNETSVRLALGRRDMLNPKLMLDSFYELSVNFSSPENRNRIINSLWVSLSYYLQKPLQISLNYQLNLSNFTQRADARADEFHRLFGQVNYRISNYSNLNLQTGISFGGSTVPNINFDGWFFSLNYSVDLGQF